MLTAKFLGTPQIDFTLDSVSGALSGRALALFTYLCVTRRPQSRSVLADLLWHDLSERTAKSNLRYVLRDLRKSIGDYLIIDRQHVDFNQELPSWIDVTTFSNHLTPATSWRSDAVEPSILQELLNLYTGEFLAGFYIQDAPNFERWMLAQRRHFHDLLIHGLQLATRQRLEDGDYQAGLAFNHQLLSLEPWREEAHRQRMFMLAATGQRSAALMQYEICCQSLEEELDVPPMEETTSLYEQIKSGEWFSGNQADDLRHDRNGAVRIYPHSLPGRERVDADPVADVTGPASPLQLDLGSMPVMGGFVGRRRELAALHQWLEDDSCRLAAILGLGGQGKSALAACFVQEHYAQALDAHASPHFAAASTAGMAHVIWRSMARKPSSVEIVQSWLQQINNTPKAELPDNFDQLLTILFATLEEQRCLLILDGIETVLQGHSPEAQLEGEAYEQLLSLFAEREHRSSLLLTSRIRPLGLMHLQKRQRLIHCLGLEGLAEEDGMELLTIYGLDSDPHVQRQLHRRYWGHPRLLTQAATLIHDLFDGDTEAFLAEEIAFPADLKTAVSELVATLSPLEQQLMQILAEAGQPLLRQTLWEKIPLPTGKEDVYHALNQLQRSFFIRHDQGWFTPATPIASYLTAGTVTVP